MVIDSGVRALLAWGIVFSSFGLRARRRSRSLGLITLGVWAVGTLAVAVILRWL